VFGKTINLFKFLEFEVRVDLSWIIIAVLAVWTLAAGFFPAFYPDLSAATYWSMGLLGALGLFLSVIFHELSHSLVARRYGMPMRGITLFIFGGVAEMEDEPPTAKSEFLMAIAGPLASVALGVLFWFLQRAIPAGGLLEPVGGIFFYLSYINLLLAAFNLLPAFPLDGGRVLRSILWAWKGRLRWSTRIASTIGGIFGILLMVLGAVHVLYGQFIGGIWFFLIGMFLRNASRVSYRQLLLRRALQGEQVRRFMIAEPVTVPPTIAVEDLVEHFVYRYHFKMYPVVEDGRLIGCVTIDGVKDVPRAEWTSRPVRSLMKMCSPENSIGPDEDAMKALATMNRLGRTTLMVVEGDRLLGIIALKDLLKLLSLKLDLEGQDRLEA
jgi:Zn-dependent protease/predicted transcriptional regulator